MGNDHENKFHEIKIAIFHEIENIAKLIMRSKIDIFHEIEFFCKIDQEIEKAVGALGGYYFRMFSLTQPSIT